MSTINLNIKVEEALHSRLERTADRYHRTLPWLVKQALLSYIENIERGKLPPELLASAPGIKTLALGGTLGDTDTAGKPFLEFAQGVAPQTPQRAAITAAWRRPEPECVSWLLKQAREPATANATQANRVRELSKRLVEGLRRSQKNGGIEALIQEFSLSSQEGVALMCLAEALLRIPDRETRDALIRDKISHGDWKSHLGHSSSLFVNATAWGLMLTGKLVATNSERTLSSSLTRLIGKGGEPLIRRSVDMAMRMMGEQFVTGETIEEALLNARKYEAKGFRYSYDMLGEAAATDEDARTYLQAYETAIHAIGKASAKRGIYDGPGISIKLSALHPRYSRAQHDRVFDELLPRLRHLALLARQHDIALNIDAEEADRLEISLDLLESLCFDPALAGWNGIGFVVQAYQKRCPHVIDYLIDLGRRSRHRLMIRLVKGAYWDSEIKRAQLDGMDGYPVYTRKAYTDVSYLVCAEKMLRAPDAIYPQFATHNARTLATIHEMAGQNYYPGQYEFQCLHGMGEPLYEQVTSATAEGGLGRPCRIYAPVGTYETLLAYLVRRLLENGANTSFVNMVSDPDIPLDKLIADPVEEAAAVSPEGAPHALIPLPRDLYAKESFGYRLNSAGVDLANEQQLATLSTGLMASAAAPWLALPANRPEPAPVPDAEGSPPAARITPPAGARAVLNPANHQDVVGYVLEAEAGDLNAILDAATAAAPGWRTQPVEDRADCLLRAAQIMEDRTPILMGLVVREAGKSLPNAIAELREAIDFLRYYANQIKTEFDNETHRPLGTILCISPWNFPLAIFSGQVAAALAAGNTVLAKPAEQTPLIAAEAVRVLHEAGVPRDVLQLVPGDGVQVGAPLVADARVDGIMFTGSTEVARIITATLAERLAEDGSPVPLIAETGGQNCMIVDSSALTEQVVQDVLVSAFDSAGQRCSALRVLCVQEDAADRVLAMLQGATRELRQGDPSLLSTDVGPVIDTEARDTIVNYIDKMRAEGFRVSQPALDLADQTAMAAGTFVPPTIIEINSIRDLGREVFGPVLHVLRYRRDRLEALIDDINGTGYGLTFGVHTRIDETVQQLLEHIHAGNLYVNRNIVGAVVGVQPFGGEGLSGTGPKAGGPLYLKRLLSLRPLGTMPADERNRKLIDSVHTWLGSDSTLKADAGVLQQYAQNLLTACAGTVEQTMPGPTGEENLYRQEGRGRVLCVATSPIGAVAQLLTCLATGNTALFVGDTAGGKLAADLPTVLKDRVQTIAGNEIGTARFEAALHEGGADGLKRLNQLLAKRDGAIVNLQSLTSDQIRQGNFYGSEILLAERSISINTAAAGGNASLMTIG
ncbi:MAG: trifunctional transcriptional regulator/proline dehydrogenase/L-glutamate gamma-semialdehyde dehydrogenase [Lautropia sp.]|nr:trifunctional transcriptional regulator/proline dehydrogenase/L-glutamate gamma-semialdehyde dehydrogenase [Lautropia sp.]